MTKPYEDVIISSRALTVHMSEMYNFNEFIRKL